MTLDMPKPHLETIGVARPQWREGRRDPLKAVFVGHSTEGGKKATASKTAGFISGRSEAGSYHLVGDERTIMYLVDFDNEAFGDRTGSNRWAIHGSLAMDAAEWSEPDFVASARGVHLVDTFAQMVAIAAHHFVDQGLLRSAVDLVDNYLWPTNPTSGSGVTSHALRDPTRRTDPGEDFPWGLARSKAVLYTLNPDKIDKLYHPEGVPPMATKPARNEYVADIQAWLQDNGAASSMEPSYLDGIMGPTTSADLMAVLNTKPGMSDAFATWVDLQRDIAAAQAVIERSEAALANMIATATTGAGQEPS